MCATACKKPEQDADTLGWVGPQNSASRDIEKHDGNAEQAIRRRHTKRFLCSNIDRGGTGDLGMFLHATTRFDYTPE